MEESNATKGEELKVDKLGLPMTDYCAKYNISDTEFKKI